MIKIAIQKGRIFNILKKKFSKVGFCFNKKSRKLILKSYDNKKEICFARSADLKIVFEKGISDFFIIGSDTYSENSIKYDFFKLKDFKCRLSVIEKKKRSCKEKILYTKYPNIISKNNKYKKYKIVKANGCLELFLKKKSCRYIFDIVDTGKTIRSNGLKIKENIKTVYIIVVINKGVKKSKIKNVMKLLK
ncbi:ATP phosphoribosyltransferase [Candidatus Vidania fulgoroideae]|nr:ATP phosphoribosyltransferase [Candidatus Vidania fulgoroideae]